MEKKLTEMSCVQALLRQSEICYLATATKEIRGGKKVPVILSVVANTGRTPEETAIFTLGNRDSSWDIRDVIPVMVETSFRVLQPQEQGGPAILEVRVPSSPTAAAVSPPPPPPVPAEGAAPSASAPQPAVPTPAAQQQFQVFLFEAAPHSMNAFVAAMTKSHATAKEGGYTISSNSHQWVKYYTLLKEASESGAVGSDDLADAVKRKMRLADRAGTSAADPDVNITWISKMLKTRESEFTTHKTMTVFFGTWNVNGQAPTALEPWLVCMDVKPDIYCIGFQELDLSAAAYVVESAQLPPWQLAIQSALKLVGDYVLVSQRLLVGILLCVYAKREHLQKISDVQGFHTPVGILGVMGNKGGVAIRFNICDSPFCVVNSHLNAHIENVTRRNQDYSDISRRVLFVGESGNPITIFDHEFLFWEGDLNYRLTGDDVDIRNKIQQRDWSSLLALDQLKQQIRANEAFEGFAEAPIRFAPTYKYEKQSSNYDSSEGARTPAWCDRVLWRAKDPDALTCLSYSRHELLSSDHRPVSAVFLLKVKSIVPEARSKVYQELLKQLDTMENEAMPDAVISANSINFGSVLYLLPQSRTITLENTGRVMARWRFIPKLDERRVHKPWLLVVPTSGIMLPGEQTSIRVTVTVDNETAPALNTGADKLDDILILHLENGKDYFITLTGQYMRSCFGMSLELLARYPHPVRTSDPLPDNSEDKLALPKELWRIVDYIYRRGMDVADIFSQSGGSDMERIRECLDTGESFAAQSFNIHSMAETLIRFLESLSDPVFPTSIYQQCLDASTSYSACRTLIGSHLSSVHYNTFYYLMSFLREILCYSEKNKLAPERLAVLFSSVLLRSPDLHARPTETVIKRKAEFILHFLVEEGGQQRDFLYK